MSVNLKLHLDEKAFDNVLNCCLDDKQTRSDLRLLLINLFSDSGYDFDLQFDRFDRLPLPESNIIGVSMLDDVDDYEKV